MGLKWRVAEALGRIGAADAILAARRRVPSPWLTVLTYHRIGDGAEHGFDPDVVDATPDAFDRQLAILKRHFSFVGIAEVRAFVERRERLPPNPLMLTFDDGYRDNSETALPILERHGAHAVFFIATSYLTERRVFWWDRINYVLRKSERSQIELTYPKPVSLSLSPRPAATLRTALRIVKDTFDLDLDRFLDELAAAADVAWTPELERKLADDVLMTWDDVRALRRAGHDVESHTRTHRVLQTLPRERLAGELAGSADDLEREIGERPSAVSYPVGRSILDADAIRRAVRDAGYAIGFSNATGAHPTWYATDPLDVRRMAMDRELSPALFRSLLAVPPLA